MDNWLKALIAAACIVVIAGGSYYVWNDQQDRKRSTEAAEWRAWSSICNQMLSEFKSGQMSREWIVANVVKCITDGHLTEKDFDGPRLSRYLDQAKPSLEFARKQSSN